MKQLTDQQFINRVCQHLDTSIEQLPLSVRQKLESGRTQALGQLSTADTDPSDLLCNEVVQTLEKDSTVPREIENRLDKIRAQAMAKLEEKHAARELPLADRFQVWLKSFLGVDNLTVPVSMFATACLLVTVVSTFDISRLGDNPEQQLVLPLDVELTSIASAEDIELYENLEFYEWLAENALVN